MREGKRGVHKGSSRERILRTSASYTGERDEKKRERMLTAKFDRIKSESEDSGKIAAVLTAGRMKMVEKNG